ncbi:MAG: DEAD/DEAH box helicase [Deltaproteobacteria bacterium]|nr:DEAD/DEAH box helicase [Deltaproteobacteria bacterium]
MQELQNDTVIHDTTGTKSAVNSFTQFHLGQPVLAGLTENGFHTPTEIQAKAIPEALKGLDLMASAQTGTGKTAAFVVPALQKLLTPWKKGGRGPRILVLTPTRELAGQVEKVTQQLGRPSRIKIGSIVGGVAYAPQERLLRGTVDVLVATPGRLIDHLERGLVDFSRLEILVLDEADRMLDMGFVKPVKKIAAALPADRQTLLFSATLEGSVGIIAKELLKNPVRIQLAQSKDRHLAIEQRLHMVEGPEHKHAMLTHLLQDATLTQGIIFTSTKRGADKLSKKLEIMGLKAAPLHGNMRQNARQRTVDSLRSGKVQLLVATDVAARGIDIQGVSHVINFDLPQVAEDYVHRIGRTGRNGATGTAISLVGPQDRSKLGAIERFTGHRLTRLEVPGLVWERATRPPVRQGEDHPSRNHGPRRHDGTGERGFASGKRTPQGGGNRRFSGASRGGRGL